jgi:hypothetical protein
MTSTTASMARVKFGSRWAAKVAGPVGDVALTAAVLTIEMIHADRVTARKKPT